MAIYSYCYLRPNELGLILKSLSPHHCFPGTKTMLALFDIAPLAGFVAP
jgi:hypothetical protein